MSLVFIVLFVLAGVVVHLAYRNEKLGVAITAGAAVLTVLLMVLEPQAGVRGTSPIAPESPTASVFEGSR